MSTTTLTTKRIAPPELRGDNLALGYCRDREVCIEGVAGGGKTVAALYKIHVLLSRYAGSRALVARKTNTALSGSAMVTYRDNILRNRTDIHYFGGNKVEPAAFKYPNGSQMIVNGLDKPEKVQSAEFDWAYLNEATECDLENIEFVRMRLRPRTGGPEVPYRQLVMDCNPSYPTHWLNSRMKEGITTRLISRHQDNPRYYDAKIQDWTEAGREYVFGILEGLTGVRYARYRLGLWAASDGTVYMDDYDPKRNLIDRAPIPDEYPRYLAIDFGYTNPFVCLWCAIDPDGRIIIYRQIYKTKTLVEDHAKEIKRVSRWGLPGGDPLPREIITDHAANERMTLERHLGLRTMPAHKTILDGIQAMAKRLQPAGDGLPRFQIMRDCVVDRDQELAHAKKPTCIEDEFEVYVWHVGNGVQTKEEPVDADNHAMDAARYLCARFDLKPSSIGYSMQRVY